MKKTILMTLMALVATTAVNAQDFQEFQERRGPSPEKRIEHQVQRLDKKLKLTDEQKQQLKDYYAEFDKMQQARMEQMRMQEKREREALDSKINSILTDEQKAKYAEMKEKDKEAWKNGMNKWGGPGPGQRPGGMPPRGGHRGGHGGHGGFDGGNMGGDFEK